MVNLNIEGGDSHCEAIGKPPEHPPFEQLQGVVRLLRHGSVSG